MNKTDVSTRVIRWILLLQEFDLTIVDKLGKYNVVADFMSRLTHTVEEGIVEDEFSNEHLFDVSTKTPWLLTWKTIWQHENFLNIQLYRTF